MGQSGVGGVQDLPGGRVSIVGIRATGIESEMIGSGLVEEIGRVLKRFHRVELIFDQRVGGFDIGLPGRGTWGEGLMAQASGWKAASQGAVG